MWRVAIFGCLLAGSQLSGQTELTYIRDGGEWIESGVTELPLRGASRVRVEGLGRMSVRTGSSRNVQLRVRRRVTAEDEATARRLLAAPAAHAGYAANQLSISSTGGFSGAEIELLVPAGVRHAEIVNTWGDVLARDLALDLTVYGGGGRVEADQIRGAAWIRSAGGRVRLGTLTGHVQVTTGSGAVYASALHGTAVLETGAGEIFVERAGADLRAATGGGNVRVLRAAGAVHAKTLGGVIRVDEAGGGVWADNGGGATLVGSARGVHCESASGSIRVAGVLGQILASTGVGSIVAELTGSNGAPQSVLATSDGDITVMIPSNLAVTVQALNELGRLGTIVTEFPEIRVQTAWATKRTVAAGALNGGGPLLKVAAANGTIFLKRQR
ncbi:MAG: DUF4097 domain-containing protein [Acidobacteria bacterium]|nr:DUF4097 domain-containing protein [Acidobacteriota bacterium]